jgi:hypothetical protein
MGSLLAVLRAGESAPRMTPVLGIEGIEGIEVVSSDDDEAGIDERDAVQPARSCRYQCIGAEAVDRGDARGQVVEDIGGRSRLGILRMGAPRRSMMPWGPIKKLPTTGMT